MVVVVVGAGDVTGHHNGTSIQSPRLRRTLSDCHARRGLGRSVHARTAGPRAAYDTSPPSGPYGGGNARQQRVRRVVEPTRRFPLVSGDQHK